MFCIAIGLTDIAAVNGNLCDLTKDWSRECASGRCYSYEGAPAKCVPFNNYIRECPRTCQHVPKS